MPRSSGSCRWRPQATLIPLFLALTLTLVCGSVWHVEAQEAGLAGRLQQAQARVRQLQQQQQGLEGRRQRLLDEQRKLLEKQAQLRKEIPEVQAALRKPLSPEQRDRQKCTLQELNAAQEQANQRQAGAQSDLSQAQQQLTQVQQQLTQAQQLASQLAQEQEQEANQRRPDRLAQIMNAPAEPLGGLPLTPGGMGRRRVIILDHRIVYSIPPGVFLWTFDPVTVTTTIRRPGGGGGQWAPDTTFTVSDGSIQNIRVRAYRDSINVPGIPVGGILYLTLGPFRMNAEIASLFIMKGGSPTVFRMFFLPNLREEGRIVFDVPDDPSIEPAIMHYIVSSE